MEINSEHILQISGDIVAREIAGETIIIPIISGVGDVQNEIYALNETGQEIWQRIDGKKNVGEIVKEIDAIYDAPEETLVDDIKGLLGELLKRKFIVLK